MSLAWTWCAPVALSAPHPLASTIGERAHTVFRFLEGLDHPLTNGHEPWAYLKDVLTRLSRQLNSRIDELLPHRWEPAGAG